MTFGRLRRGSPASLARWMQIALSQGLTCRLDTETPHFRHLYERRPSFDERLHERPDTQRFTVQEDPPRDSGHQPGAKDQIDS